MTDRLTIPTDVHDLFPEGTELCCTSSLDDGPPETAWVTESEPGQLTITYSRTRHWLASAARWVEETYWRLGFWYGKLRGWL